MYLLLILSVNAKATNYYFSNSGSDGNSGTIGSPWQTITKLNSVFSSLSPGDSVLFNRGDVFTGQVVISRSGSVGSPIVIGAYGSGVKPVINGFSTISSWTSLGGSIYESSSAVSTLSTLNMLTIDGTPYAMGRFPNANATNKGYLTYQSGTNGSITSNAISSIKGFIGAELVVRLTSSYTDRCRITGQTSNTITYTPQSGSNPNAGYGFFFENSDSTLDQHGEWYYDPSSKKLRIYLSSAPGGYTIKVTTIDTLVKASSRSYITFDNIDFEGNNTYCFAVTGGTSFIVQNCDLNYSGNSAICIAATSSFKADQDSINWSHNRGFNGFQSNTATPIVTNNYINHTGYFPGMGAAKSSTGVLVGIEVTTAGSLVKGNTVLNSGYHGIRFYGDNTVVEHNYVDTFCFNKDDGGGIYTWNGSNSTHTGMLVRRNVVLNGIGAPEGTNRTNGQAVGYYFDDYSNGILIDSNTSGNVNNMGYYLHDGRNVVSRGNTFYNSTMIFRTSFDAGAGITGCTTNGNIFFARLSTQYCTWFSSITSGDFVNIGTFDSNYYCRPIFEPNGINSTGSATGGVIHPTKPSTYYSLDVWQSLYGFDVHSHKTYQTVSDVNKIRFEYNETPTNKNINLSPNSYIEATTGTPKSGTITLTPYSSIILIDQGTPVTQRYYQDADGDTYGNASVYKDTTVQPTGYVTNSTDCNDANSTVHPNALEVCDGVDNNCNGFIDENVQTTYFRDADDDGYGNPTSTTQACSVPVGYVTNNTDCNDSNASVNPGVTEVCANGIDDNCNGQVDEGCGVTPGLYIADTSFNESTGQAVVRVYLTAVSSSDVMVSYKSLNMTATSPKDYKAVKSTLTIPAGSLTAFITVILQKDRIQEPTEYFNIVLSNAINSNIVDNSATISIINTP